MRSVVWTVVLCLLAVPAFAADPPKPLADTPAAKRAFQDLAALYQNDRTVGGVDQAFKDLAADKAETRAEAGQYLLALLRQSWADETNGRAQWKALPYFGGGSESAAREFRKQLAEKIAAAPPAEELLDAELWLINTDLLAADTAAGVKALVKNPSPRKVDAYHALLAPAHPNTAVVVEIVKDAGTRKLALQPEITALCNDFRKEVRAAARDAAAALTLKDGAEFSAEKALDGFVAGQLKSIGNMILAPAPKDAAWKRFTVKIENPRADRPDHFDFSGFLLAEEKDSYRILNTFGVEETLEKSKATMADRAMAEDVKEILAFRSSKDEDGPRQNPLSSRGMLTGQFEPGFISLPEALLATWAFERGDLKNAAALILPCYDRAADARWIVQATRDLLARGYHQQMLDAFAGARDYAAVIRIGTHLGKPEFDGWQYYTRTKELAAQIAQRGEDFKTLVLPTPEEWKTLQGKLNRAEQVEYLGRRLRLLNAFQWGQPGGVDFEETQTRETHASLRQTGEDAKRTEVINPLLALEALDLEVKDLPALLAFADDDNYVLAYGYWRDFHPARYMYRVNGFVRRMVDRVAGRDLVDWKAYEAADAPARKALLETARAWIAANGGKSRTDIDLANLKELKDPGDVVGAAHKLTKAKVAAALPVMFERIAELKDDRARGELMQCCYRLAPENSLEQARGWAKQDGDVKFWAAMILFSAGDREKNEGVAELKEVLAADKSLNYYRECFDVLLKSDRKEAADLAAGVVKQFGPEVREYDWRPFIHRLLLAGRQEALDFLLQALDDQTSHGTSFFNEGDKEVKIETTNADAAARIIAEMRTDKYEYPRSKPAAERAAECAKLRTWIKEQFALIRAGKEPALRKDLGGFAAPQWMLDAPR